MESSSLPPSSQTKALLSALTKYTTDYPERPYPLQLRKDEGEVILVTGTTGGFGCNILAQLSLDPRVKRIYALNRSSPKGGLVDRQLKALKQRGVLDECLRSSKFELIEADLGKPLLGLSPGVYEEVSQRAAPQT